MINPVGVLKVDLKRVSDSPSKLLGEVTDWHMFLTDIGTIYPIDICPIASEWA